MVDTLTKEQRSIRMAAIRSRDTKPEILIRKMLHGLGYRFTTGNRKLPGSPDLVFSKRKKVIFMHGCFWHNHNPCKIGHIPKSRSAFWQAKFEGNVARDVRNIAKLEADGWKVLVVWECSLKNLKQIQKSVVRFLGPAKV